MTAVHATNAAVYDAPFLRALRDRLEPEGALVVWSAERAPKLGRTASRGPAGAGRRTLS